MTADKNQAKRLTQFCDLLCRHAELPKDEAVDGSGSCRTFVALYCRKKKSLVHKNMPCRMKAAAAVGKAKGAAAGKTPS